MNLALDSETLAEARSFNRKLYWAPRFKINNRLIPLVIQTLLRLSQLGSDGKLARDGIRVTRYVAQADGWRVPVRILRGVLPARAVVLDFHGGGWAIGNAAMNDQLNAGLIAACDVAVVSDPEGPTEDGTQPQVHLASISQRQLLASLNLPVGSNPEAVAVASDGSYGIPEGLVYSYPVTTRDGEWSIVEGLDIDDFSRSRMDASAAELSEEREAVKGLGLI